jgi:hypothetical protein
VLLWQVEAESSLCSEFMGGKERISSSYKHSGWPLVMRYMWRSSLLKISCLEAPSAESKTHGNLRVTRNGTFEHFHPRPKRSRVVLMVYKTLTTSEFEVRRSMRLGISSL